MALSLYIYIGTVGAQTREASRRRSLAACRECDANAVHAFVALALGLSAQSIVCGVGCLVGSAPPCHRRC